MQFPTCPRPRRRAAFSLVELVIAISILSMSLMAGLPSQFAALRLLGEARETDLATEVLLDGMAQLRLRDRAQLADAAGARTDGAAVETLSVLPGQDLRYRTTNLGPGEPLPECLDLRLVLTWTSSAGRTRTASLLGSRR